MRTCFWKGVINMGKYTAEDVMRMVEEENIRFIRLQFTDIFGSFKNIAITASQLEKALQNKCMFDGSSIEGFVRIEESDMYLYPCLLYTSLSRVSSCTSRARPP